MVRTRPYLDLHEGMCSYVFLHLNWQNHKETNKTKHKKVRDLEKDSSLLLNEPSLIDLFVVTPPKTQKQQVFERSAVENNKKGVDEGEGEGREKEETSREWDRESERVKVTDATWNASMRDMHHRD